MEVSSGATRDTLSPGPPPRRILSPYAPFSTLRSMIPSSSFLHCTRSSSTFSSVYDLGSSSRTVSVLRVSVFRAELNCVRDEKYFTDAVMSVSAALLAPGNQCRWLQEDVKRLYFFDAR